MLGTLTELLQLVDKAPAAIRLAKAAQAAANGDPSAVQYLKEHWTDGVDLVRPGAGETAQQVLDKARQAALDIRSTITGEGQYIDAEFRELGDEETGPRPPFQGFVNRMLRTPYGGHIFLGPMGSGKTSSAVRLALRYAEIHGYLVECINMYRGDVPDGAVQVGISTLVWRMRCLKAYLDKFQVRDPNEPVEEDDDGPPALAVLPPRKRVIIIDEAGMAITSNGKDPARRAAINALQQCRHCDWIVVYIGQMASQIPEGLLGQCVVWCKHPNGDEDKTDRDNPKVRELWRAASEGFATIRQSPYWAHFPDVRAWSYCDCKSLNGGRGYEGMVPFGRGED